MIFIFFNPLQEYTTKKDLYLLLEVPAWKDFSVSICQKQIIETNVLEEKIMQKLKYYILWKNKLIEFYWKFLIRIFYQTDLKFNTYHFIMPISMIFWIIDIKNQFLVWIWINWLRIDWVFYFY